MIHTSAFDDKSEKELPCKRDPQNPKMSRNRKAAELGARRSKAAFKKVGGKKYAVVSRTDLVHSQN